MPQERKVPVFEKGIQTGVRTGVASTAKQERDLTYSERMEAEDKKKSEAAEQKKRDESLLPSPQVKRALSAATGFGGPKS